jgi:hypothetical protein
MIYYSLRCGFHNLVLEITQSSFISDTFIEAMNLLKNKSPIPNDLQSALSSEFKNSKDIFQQVSYQIVGKCESTKINREIIDKTEDWVWFKVLNSILLNIFLDLHHP